MNMKPCGPYFKSKHEICLYGILLISAILPALLAVINIKISPDSMIYALMSQEIISGNGLKIPIIKLVENYVPVNGTISYPEEGPLLPILFALLGGVMPQNYLPAQIINVISHLLISIFTFLLMKKLYDNQGIALLTGILVSLAYPMLWNTHHMITEPLFTALTVIVLYFLVLSRHSDNKRRMRNHFLAGIFTCFAILARFPGIALIPLFFWEALVLMRSTSNKRKYLSAVLATIPPIITVSILFLRNYLHSGTIFGWNPPPFERSYLNAFTGTIDMIFRQFSLGQRPAAFITIFAILFVIYIILNSDARKELSKHVHSGLDLVAVFTCSYTMLIFLAMAKSQSVYELRFVSPLVPFLFILCIIINLFVWETIRSKGLSKLSLCGIILSLGIITFGNCYKTYQRSGEFFYKQQSRYSILNSLTYTWIKENYGKNTIIATNRPYEFSFFGGYSTVVFPHRRFGKNYRIDNIGSILPDRMSVIGSRVLALFEKVEEQYEGKYLATLFNKREDNDNFILIHEFPDGVVYELRE